jgi:hypothetical protein
LTSSRKSSRSPLAENLLRSDLYPHGRDVGGAIRKAMTCPKDDLYFGLALDDSWSIPVAPLNIKHTLVSRGRT